MPYLRDVHLHQPPAESFMCSTAMPIYMLIVFAKVLLGQLHQKFAKEDAMVDFSQLNVIIPTSYILYDSLAPTTVFRGHIYLSETYFQCNARHAKLNRIV